MFGLNIAQWFMAVQIVTCAFGALGFLIAKQPWAALVWIMYSAANIGWFMIASGAK